ncbi:hypothetical protein SAMN02745165_02849 [Malonomonas rubra DSM 5091]|uniref:Membrane-associated sensor domain-containing protein n=1 Tax=Malonomonas rubra DSM 5091 TaxID=1122189 RepID=A0A1M6KZ67_MALRU|nr:MASE3 domain-containing protein [Malonomonas rubra]SHJ64164.1 hypothetical protein SAMN02745165_02849 [Malonomonas rubra DSM 5091]
MEAIQEKTLFKLDVAILLATLGLLFFNYLAFHITVEFLCAFFAMNAGVVVFRSEQSLRSTFCNILAVTLCAVALVDIMHLLAYKGMDLLPVHEANAATQFWVIGRYVLALGILVATLCQKQLPIAVIIAATGIVTGIAVAGVFSGHFPDAFIDGYGLTQFKVLSEYVIISMLIISILLISFRQQIFSVRGHFLFISALGVTILSELMFTLYQDVYGIFNAAGHVLKLIAYLLLLHLFHFYYNRGS